MTKNFFSFSKKKNILIFFLIFGQDGEKKFSTLLETGQKKFRLVYFFSRIQFFCQLWLRKEMVNTFLSLSLSHARTLSLSLSYTHLHFRSRALSATLSPLTHAHFLSLSHTSTVTNTHISAVTLFPSFSLSLPFSPLSTFCSHFSKSTPQVANESKEWSINGFLARLKNHIGVISTAS